MANFKGGSLNDVFSGSGLSDWIAGLAGNDTLTGNDGADTLDGGAGADSLKGGAGNDTYVVDNVGDKIDDNSGTDDRILASINIDLAAYPGIEHATLTGATALNASGTGSANMLVGNSGANHLDGKAGADTMIGGDGNDIYEVDGPDKTIELANGGIDQVNSSVGLNLGANVENLTLSGISSVTGLGNDLANKITANTAGDALGGLDGNDTLIGNIGNDSLVGGDGADSMVGGAGNDVYFVDDAGDKVAESGPSTDVDEVQSSITDTLGANLENLTLTGSDFVDGTGNNLDNAIVGNSSSNVLSGLGGDDVIDGGDDNDLLLGGEGNDTLVAGFNFADDTLIGGAGNDLFQFVSTGGPSIIADFNGLPGGDQLDLSALIGTPGAGSESLFIQTVTAGGSTTVRVDQDGLGGKFAFADVAVLLGVSTDLQGLLANGAISGLATPATPAFQGSAGADSHAGAGVSDLMFGLAGNDTLSGNAGADTLDGGAGMDSLVGGAGNDSYVIDSAGDKIDEAGGGTDDRILASINIDLTANAVAYAGIEHVTLTGVSALNATGNGGANMLIGNSGANHLDGKAGADTLIGGDGNDVYEVDSSSDQVIEFLNGGIDQVNSSASFTLGANVENLTLTGTGAITGTGNELANKITGNLADNTLTGSGGNDTLTGNDGDDRLDGGQGADSMAGGTGDDTYRVDNVGDKVVESGPPTDTADTVQSTIAYTLGANIENLTLLGLGSGTGNGLNNTILGSSFDNVLSGLAGADAMNGNLGNDLLLGGDGNDTLVAAQGSDTLVGGAGADDFFFVSGSLDGVDTILGFDGLPGGDKIDVSALLVGFQPGVSNINDFLKTAAVDGGTLIQVDKDGTANGVAFVDMVSLLGLSTDLPGLTNNGTIVGVGTTAVAPIDGTAAADSKASGGNSDLLRGFAGNDTLSGNGGSDTLAGGAGNDSLVGGAGNDAYVIDSVGDKIDESGGGADDRIVASIGVDLTANAVAYAGIEHVTLTGTSALNATGNGANNMLIGNGDANILDGGAGNDTLVGGAGNDTYKVDSTTDVVIELPGEGTDTVISTATSFALGNADIENLTLTGSAPSLGAGNALANKITGNAPENDLRGLAGNDTLTGNSGEDTLDGGTGADSMVGGDGNDVYIVDDVGDVVKEAGASIDTVQSSIAYTLAATLERLLLVDAANIDGTGNSLNNQLTGNFGDNVLSGLAGNDRLKGGEGKDLLLGGDGNDILSLDKGLDTAVGGAGSDVFRFDSLSLDGPDVIADFVGGPGGDAIDLTTLVVGFDFASDNINDFLKTSTANGSTTIQVDVDGTANGVAFVDMVTLQGVSTDLAGLLTTGRLLLPGDTAAETLDGGTKTDSLFGGKGNDTYIIDSVGDKISDPGGANDRILASINIDLAAYAGIEHVTLTGSAALAAAGNGSANMLVGNGAANHLDGKAGADTMIGGDGNDIYEVDSKSDQVIELANGGIDQVNSSADFFALGAGIENLTVVGAGIGATGNDLANKITANAAGNFSALNGLGGDDTLIGNSGANVLDGGTGADSMAGGAGNDSYIVDDAGDVVVESGPSTDIEEVDSSVTFTLGANLEQLRLEGGATIDGTGNSLGNEIQGNDQDNVLSGLSGDDELEGRGGNDLLLGGDGNDSLFADQGNDILVGGAGNDVFGFFVLSLDGPDTIADLNGLPGGDVIKIDAPSLMPAFNPGVSKIGDFLKTTTANGSTLIQVDTDGTAAGVGFVDLMTLQGVSTDLAGLLANGALTGVGGTTVAPLDGTAAADNKAGGASSDLIRGLAGNDTLTGNAGADTLDGGAGADSLVGGAGNDSYVIDNAGDKISDTGGDKDDRILASIGIDLTANAAIYAGVEHVTLTGTSALNATGDGFANMLVGNSGANHLDGKAGADTMIGAEGNDIYEVDSVSDQVIELANGGIDQVNSAVDFTLGANIENLTLTGVAISGIGNDLANKVTGNAADNTLRGADGNDTLTGNEGNDTLDGGTGADSMAGGVGNDIYRVDDVGDVVAESGPSTDRDSVTSSITYTLGANLENLTLKGSATIDGAGNGLNNFLLGNSGDNILSGLGGDDILVGIDGNDLLIGGAGNDTLEADENADTLVGGAGKDLFQFSDISLDGVDAIADLDALPGGDQIDVGSLLSGFVSNVSNVNDFLKATTSNGSTLLQVDLDGTANGVAFVDMVVLQGVSTDIAGLLANGVFVRGGSLLAASTVPIQGTAGIDNKAGTGVSDLMLGLAGNDTLIGNAGADTLDGGAGKDSLIGGAGNDTYVIDSTGDATSEIGGDANDRILASISIDLAANAIAFAGIEHVTLTGSAALNATGSDLANMLIGNSGANILDGGVGNDTLVGGAGNDTYKVDSSSDLVTELPGEGVDTVLSTAVSFTLSANIENLTLTGNAFATGTGNGLANTLVDSAAGGHLFGVDGNDTLIGNTGNDTLDGGTGIDSMVGGAGSDFYIVDNVGDKVTESGPSTDKDEVDSAITYTIGATIEQLRLTGSDNIDGTGNALDNFINGNAGDNVLSGLAGNDSLFGGVGSDLLLGGDGNDLLNAGNIETMVGGAGSDTFRFDFVSGADVITDFTGGLGGDVLDLHILLSGFDFASDNINDFLKASTANGSTTIQADVDGTANGVNFVDFVQLQGVSTDLAGLVTNGNVILE